MAEIDKATPTSTLPSEAAGIPNPKPVQHIPPPRSTSYLRLPPELAAYVTRVDETLLRLNQLLTTTTGLESTLSTLNYTFYFLSSAHSSPSPFTTLATLLTTTRTTLRLSALLPLYHSLRSLLSGSPGGDQWLYQIQLAQLTSYFIYQFLENVAHLVDLRVLPFELTTSPWLVVFGLHSTVSSTERLWLVNSRFWLAGILLDIVKLLRQWQISSTSKAAEAAEADHKWLPELLMAACWAPIALRDCVSGGVRGLNDGVVGGLGICANWQGLRGAWEGTKEE